MILTTFCWRKGCYLFKGYRYVPSTGEMNFRYLLARL